MMEHKKTIRLNELFEKVVDEKANVVERRELNVLYQEYINDGREECQPKRTSSHYLHATA